MGYKLDIVNEIEARKRMGELSEKRVACASCGNTWIEVVGLIIQNNIESHDRYLRIGLESEHCQTCRFRTLECPKCGSKDVYEISFVNYVPEEAPLNFKEIKIVNIE